MVENSRLTELTRLSYWFPKLEAAGLPVPKTEIIEMPKEAQAIIWDTFDGKSGGDGRPYVAFCDEIRAAGERMGWPCFLRTDHTSDKHRWNRTCFLPSPDDVPQHVFNIAEFSECADIMGLPWNIWAVREYLPIMPRGVCPGYADMPLCREFRFFVDEGEVRCWHPYWPREAIEQGGGDVSVYDGMAAAPDDYATIFSLAHKAARAVEGAWSVDVLETERGWYITDMAEANKSYHWPGCQSLVDRTQD